MAKRSIEKVISDEVNRRTEDKFVSWNKPVLIALAIVAGLIIWRLLA